MTTFKLSTLSAAAVLAMAGFSANAAEVEFSYTYGAEDFENVGTTKAETYDVAIRITDPSLVGSKIKAFNVPIPETDLISNISVWASKALTLDKKVNVPDIASFEASAENGAISFTFPEMIEIPEGGLYVGYTFTVDSKDDLTAHPVTVAGKPCEDGLYMHTTRTYLKWKAYSSTLGASSAITVTLDGDFQANALGVMSVTDPFATPGETATLKTTLVNHGAEPVSSIEYTVGGIGDDTVLKYSFEEPVSLSFGQSFVADLPFVAPTVCDEYPLDFKLTKVNGDDNKDISNSGNALLLVLTEVPVHKPLMEEYTGLWCGYCPRGFAGLERMNNLYPDDFVAISYHNADAMERTSAFPSSIPGFPAGWIDRLYSVDAYYGDDYDSFFGIEPFWLNIKNQFTPAVVNGSAEEAEDGSITVKSDIMFAKSVNGSYKVAYVIVADGLYDESWGQANNFAGQKPSNFVPEMEKFCKGGRSYYGLVFDDVYAAGSNLFGEASSLIENVEKDKVYTHEYSFAADAGMSTQKYNLFLNAKELHAVIILLDENGAVVNTNKVPVFGHKSGVNAVENGNAEVSAEYFDLSGRSVANPSNGIFVKVATLEDGSKVTTKVVLGK